MCSSTVSCLPPRSQRPREHPPERRVREERRDAPVPLLSTLLSLPLPSSPVPLPLPQSSASGGRAPVLHTGWHIQRAGRVPGRPSPLLGGEQLGGGGPGAQWPHTDPAQLPTLPGQQRHASEFDLFITADKHRSRATDCQLLCHPVSILLFILRIWCTISFWYSFEVVKIK